MLLIRRVIQVTRNQKFLKFFNVVNIIKAHNATLLYPKSQIEKHYNIVEMLRAALYQKNGYYLITIVPI